MGELETIKEEICRILRNRFRCVCSLRRPPYCACVVDLANLVLEVVEKEEADSDG